MANFWKYSGSEERTYPAYQLDAVPGYVYDFGAGSQPGDGRWVSDPGPATAPPPPVLPGVVASGPQQGDVPIWDATSASYKPGNLSGTTTRRAAHTFCSPGDDGTTSVGKWNARYALRLPITPTRFRLRVANYDVRNAGASTCTATPIAAAFIGTHALDANGLPTGKMSGTPVDLGITGTMPSDGTYWTSAWITDPNALAILSAGKHAVLSIGVNGDGTSRTGIRGWNRAWVSFNSANAGVVAPGDLGQYNYSLYDIVVEYEYRAPAGQNPVVLCIGDSLTTGYNASAAAPSIWSYPAQMAQRTKCAPINLGEYGSTTGVWVPSTSAFWTRADLANYAPDVAIIHLGSNNAAASNALSAYQSDMVAIVNNVQAFSSVKRVFACTVPPRNLATGTLTAAAASGVTSLTTTINPGTGAVTVGSGSSAETVTVSSVTGSASPYTLTLSAATTKAHNSGDAVLSTQETARTQYNGWLRSFPLGLAGVIDLDLLLRNPSAPTTLLPEYDSGDGIHLTMVGYGAVAGAASSAVHVS